MATEVYKSLEIELQDGKEVTLKPLPIGALRRFMEAWKTIDGVTDDDSSLDVYINCSGIALEKHFKDDFENLRATEVQRKKGEFLSPEYKEYLEEVIDLDTSYTIMDVCGGIKLNDPKLQELMEEAIEQAQDGEN